jgi:plastocyanin
MKSFIAFTLTILALNLSAAEHIVTIQGFSFNPATLEVAVGDTIVFTNNDRAPHNVVPRATSAGQFTQSPLLSTGESFTLEVASLDDISAFCSVHPRMPGIEIFVAE